MALLMAMKRGVAASSAGLCVCVASVSQTCGARAAKSCSLASPSTMPVVRRASRSIAPASHKRITAEGSMPP